MLPPVTPGCNLGAFYNADGFSVPGERGGFPDAGLWDDFSPVLGGYSSEPEGELQVAAFSTGHKRHEPFYLIMFSVLIFSTGINVRPTADGFTTVGVLGKPGIAQLVFAAIERGSKVNADLSDKWDYWPLVELPIDEVRRRLNILPAS